jgi:nucleotide-binding universal stress UspA family protein
MYEEEPMGGSIVCGVDDTPDARAALLVASRLAGQLKLRLVVARVVQRVQSLGPGTIPVAAIPRDRDVRAANAMLERMADEEGLDAAELRVVDGIPAERLADLADEEGAELIVVGSRGRGAFKAAFLGSVSGDLIGVARCPVLVVPHGVTERLATTAVLRGPSWAKGDEDERQTIVDEYDAIRKLPGVVGGGQLQPVETATTVRVQDGETLLTDRPFIDAKEHLGGYLVIEADHLDAALDIAAQIPAARMGGAIEVRPLVER